MKTDFTTLNRILEPNGRFEVPIYQRTYDWGKKQCKQFFDDIIEVGNYKQEQFHFIGAMTLVGEITMPDTDVGYYQVIDGQQRLTTLLLLLRALRESLDESTENVTEQKINQLLFNVNEKEDGVNYYKLTLTEDDDRIFKDIMKNGTSESSNNITANFKYFISLLNKDKINPDIIWRGIRRLTMVEILINEKDNAQAIFESMNSTGLDLSETDMIQNYLLMSEDSETQKKIYYDYWSPMEKLFGEEREKDFEDFIRYYLSMHRGKIVSEKEMYEYFKTHMKNCDKKKEIEKMFKYSKYYANLVNLSPHSSTEINKLLKHIYNQDTKTANSLLLKLLGDYADDKIKEDKCGEVLVLVDSYLSRGHVCGMTKGGNKVFPEMTLKVDENNYAKSIENILMSKMGNRRFPRDGTFKENLERLPIYLNRTMCEYMLVRLEHHENKNKEKVDIDNLTIEHIMPQTLTDEWKKDLGPNWKEIHEKYINVIGNLTLTAYNPELSNSPFSSKREIYKKSNLKMNRDLAEYTSWTVDDIEKRTKSLCDDAVKIWKCPTGYDSDKIIDYDEIYEEEYLEGTNIPEIWNGLKEKILSIHDGIKFEMKKVYGGFYTYRNSKNVLICTLEARKNRIRITYNIKFDDNILRVSNFIKDISNVGHYGVGDLCSILVSEDDIEKVVDLVKIVHAHKIETKSD